MQLSHITIHGFKSFAKKTTIDVTHNVTGVVGPNGSGKSNIAEAIRFVLGEQSMKSMRSKIGADVIFKGSEHLPSMSRASVSMVIDNRKTNDKDKDVSCISDSLAPFLVYDELILSRTIYRDGTSDYTLNNAKVRLKDVQELLSFAGIGGSAHTIINQGEADRILLSSLKDRKEALEDALGLRVFHLRINESLRKLEKVKINVREVDLLRNEIKPHLQHLERQVKKIEQEEAEKKRLYSFLVSYFKKEDREIKNLQDKVNENGSSSALLVVCKSIEKELQAINQSEVKKGDNVNEKIIRTEKERLLAEMKLATERRNSVIKTIGRLEGEKSFLEKQLQKEKEITKVTIPIEELRLSHTKIKNFVASLFHFLSLEDIIKAKEITEEISDVSNSFFNVYTQENFSNKEGIQNSIDEILNEIKENEKILTEFNESVLVLEKEINEKNSEVLDTKVKEHEEEKKKMLLESKLRELESTILLRKQEESELSLRKEQYNSLLEESVVIVGRSILDYSLLDEDEVCRNMNRYDLLKATERSKLRIEEAGISNKEEILNEYKNTKERDEYLLKELLDIQESEKKLYDLIEDLTNTLTDRFSSGVDQVSKIFGDFFKEIFPGGRAKLIVTKNTRTDDDGNIIEEEGIDIDVSLPNKKVKDIHMFSGGERALVSIALLFAMSQVTPPPFMVLDETDAPLDESNARKYGFMIKRLAENSRLLVITHNRETMNHCDMLYGVTIGIDGGSKLLSINFKELV